MSFARVQGNPETLRAHVTDGLSSDASRIRLPPPLAADVRAIMGRRAMKNGDVMRELGLNPLNASLGMALRRGTQIQNDLINALETWVGKNLTP